MNRIEYLDSAEESGRRGVVAILLFSGLIALAVIMTMSAGLLNNTRQAIVAISEQRFKIVEPSFSSRDVPQLHFFQNNLGQMPSLQDFRATADRPESGLFRVSTSGNQEIAKNGAVSPLGPVRESPPKIPSKRNRLFHPIIKRAAAQYKIDPALVRAIIFAESGYNPTAVSKRGAMGLMQLMPGTAKAMGVEDCFDPEHNIFGGVKYFKKLVNRFDGDVELALAAYNAGSRRVREFNGVPPFKSTEHYIQKVMKYYKIFKSQQSEPLEMS